MTRKAKHSPGIRAYAILVMLVASFARTAAFAAESSSSDKFMQVKGFKVEIDGAGGKEVDTAWESVTGGELVIELAETTIGSDRIQALPGATIGEITVRVGPRDKRHNLAGSVELEASEITGNPPCVLPVDTQERLAKIFFNGRRLRLPLDVSPSTNVEWVVVSYRC